MSGERSVDPTLHLRCGWWALLAFLSLGMLLEALHGFKIRFYLDVSNETRRLLWTLAHAHGALLGILNIVFAASLRAFPELATQSLGTASRCLLGANLVLPAGFFLGGVSIWAGDPGVGVALVPLGGLLLFWAVFQVALATLRASKD